MTADQGAAERVVFLTGMNGQVACEPFASTAVTAKLRSGLATIEQKTQLARLKVVFGDAEGEYLPGDVVCLDGSHARAQWAQREYEVGAERVILVPKSVVLLRERCPAGLTSPAVALPAGALTGCAHALTVFRYHFCPCPVTCACKSGSCNPGSPFYCLPEPTPFLGGG